MSGDKPGATPRADDAKRRKDMGVVPGLSPRSLATFRLCPHGVRPRRPSSQSPDRPRSRWIDARGINAIRPLAHTKRKRAKSLPQGILIRRLNLVIRGWGNYYRHVVSKEVFNDIDHAIWRMTWTWAKRRHPQRARKWVKDRYYARREGCDWVFTDGSVDLFRMLSIPIRRHVLIRGASNPYDPEHASYFAARRARQRNEVPALPPAWLVS